MTEKREPKYKPKGRFKLTLNMSNSAFQDEAELPRILRDVAYRVERGTTGAPILDINGNTCGFFEITITK